MAADRAEGALGRCIRVLRAGVNAITASMQRNEQPRDGAAGRILRSPIGALLDHVRSTDIQEAGGRLIGVLGGGINAYAQSPLVSHVAVFLASEFLKVLVAQVSSTMSFYQDYQDLLSVLKDLEKHIDQFDRVTDVSKGTACETLRPVYDELCDALADVNLRLAHKAAAQTLDVRVSCATLQVLKMKLKALHKELKPASEHKEDMRKASENRPCLNLSTVFVRTREKRQGGPPPEVKAASATPKYVELYQHSTDGGLVPRIQELLATTRNIGIVGMAGIGKTAIARAIFESSKFDKIFDKTVWLTVGRQTGPDDKPTMLALLQNAYDQLFDDGTSYPFTDSAEGLQSLIADVRNKQWKVLLVLDGVWHSTQHAVLGELNFVTRPGWLVAGSRLIVTTRQHGTLSYAPYVDNPEPIKELKIVEAEVLNEKNARELFRAKAMGNAEALPEVAAEACERMITACGGLPGALTHAAAAVYKRSPAEWSSKLAAMQTSGAPWASCEDSVCDNVLPPSMRECYIAFAAFPAGQAVPAMEVLHLVAARWPAHTNVSMEAAERKLRSLVQHSVVSETTHQGRLAYKMHPAMHRIAVRQAEAVRAPGAAPNCERRVCCFQAAARDIDQHATHVRYASLNGPALMEGVLRSHNEQAATVRAAMRACIVTEVSRRNAKPHWPARLRHLRLGGNVDVAHDVTKANLLLLNSLCLAMSTNVTPLLCCILPAPGLVHLDLSGCTDLQLQDVIDRVTGCTQLTHLNLSGCTQLLELPEIIVACSQLARLDLSGCVQLETLPRNMNEWCQLCYLNLSGCTRLSNLPERIGACTMLQHLDLSGCSALNCLPDGIGGCINLTHLDLTGSGTEGEVPASIRDCRLLHLPDLGGTQPHASWTWLQVFLEFE